MKPIRMTIQRAISVLSIMTEQICKVRRNREGEWVITTHGKDGRAPRVVVSHLETDLNLAVQTAFANPASYCLP
jgi:hypothetical protein